MTTLQELKERFAAHPDLWPGERLRVHVELFAIRAVRGVGFFATTIAGLAIAHQLGKDDMFSPEVLGAIGVALAVTFSVAWFFVGNTIEKWRVARALRVADGKRDLAGVNVGGASVAFSSMPAALDERASIKRSLRGAPLLEGLYAPHEVPEEEAVER